MAGQVGIVLVSHSAALAEGAAELARQVAGGGVVIAAAGGTADGRLGTSADKVTTAVRRASTGAGVLVLPDLGSAVLTVKTLLTDLEDDDSLGAGAPGEAPGDASPGVGSAGSAGPGGAAGPLGSFGPVEVADAPFVEGAVAAAVTAAAGAPLAAVRAAAEEARHARKL
jgi:phosphoenolpyruvate---glycerone phosphotransferase subunit DhaM